MTMLRSEAGKKAAGASDKAWSPDLYQEKLIPRTALARHCAQAFAPRKIDNCISDERLESAYKGVANLVVEHGDGFLPIFQFLDKEVARRREKAALIRKARNVSMC